MTPGLPKPDRDSADNHTCDSVADELREESEKLRELADKLKAREEALSEMETNYESLAS